MTRDALKKLFPNAKFPTAGELKAKEDSFSVGDRVKVSDNIRCRQHGQTGTIVQIDPEDKYNWKSFVVKFDDDKYGAMGFNSGAIDKITEKKASCEQYTSGSGKVESYKKDKTEGHDEIVLRLKDGRRIVISNNTKLGIRVEPKNGDEMNYHGYGVKGTNVVHKVHPNRSSRGGWLEHVKKAASNKDFDDIVKAYKDRYGVDLSHMMMRWSKHPVYNDGRRSYELDDDETGGSWVNDSTVRINPNMGPVMKRFGIEGMTQREFRKRLIAHELAHEVYHKQQNKAEIKKLIRDTLAKARAENFTTVYLDTYGPDTPKKKIDDETFAEYMSEQLNKKGEAVRNFTGLLRLVKEI